MAYTFPLLEGLIPFEISGYIISEKEDAYQLRSQTLHSSGSHLEL